MSKKTLGSILDKLPPATVSKSETESPVREKKEMPQTPVKTSKVITTPKKSVQASSVGTERLSAGKVSKSIKRQMRQRILESDGQDTERTIILRGLREIGFDIPDDELIDRRGGDRRK